MTFALDASRVPTRPLAWPLPWMQVACHPAIWHVLCFPAIFVRNGYASRVPARTLARLLPWAHEGTALALAHAQAMCAPAMASERNRRRIPLLALPWAFPCTLVREATLVAGSAVACNGARSSWPRWGVVGVSLPVLPWPGVCVPARACPQPGVLVKSCVRCALCGRNTSPAAPTARQLVQSLRACCAAGVVAPPHVRAACAQVLVRFLFVWYNSSMVAARQSPPPRRLRGSV